MQEFQIVLQQFLLSNPVPAKPTKRSEPILLANNAEPITNHPTFLSAKKYSEVLERLRDTYRPIPIITNRYKPTM